MPEEQPSSSDANETARSKQPVESFRPTGSVQPVAPSTNQPTNQLMEVHHHPHVPHGRKKFKEYFLEFLMIFLAVTLGFLAEGLREGIGDHEKEREYISSLIKNVEADTINLRFTIDANEDKLKGLTRLMNLAFVNMSDPANRKLLYQYTKGRSVGYYSVFRSSDATMQQLKNSGGLRVIRKDHVADSIVEYDNGIKGIYAAETIYWNATDMAMLSTHEVLDYSLYHDTTYFNDNTRKFSDKNFTLLSNDPAKLKAFFNKVDYEMGATENYLGNLKGRLPYIKSFLAYLKKVYDIE